MKPMKKKNYFQVLFFSVLKTGENGEKEKSFTSTVASSISLCN